MQEKPEKEQLESPEETLLKAQEEPSLPELAKDSQQVNGQTKSALPSTTNEAETQSKSSNSLIKKSVIFWILLLALTLMVKLDLSYFVMVVVIVYTIVWWKSEKVNFEELHKNQKRSIFLLFKILLAFLIQFVCASLVDIPVAIFVILTILAAVVDWAHDTSN